MYDILYVRLRKYATSASRPRIFSFPLIWLLTRHFDNEILISLYKNVSRYYVLVGKRAFAHFWLCLSYGIGFGVGVGVGVGCALEYTNSFLPVPCTVHHTFTFCEGDGRTKRSPLPRAKFWRSYDFESPQFPLLRRVAVTFFFFSFTRRLSKRGRKYSRGWASATGKTEKRKENAALCGR